MKPEINKNLYDVLVSIDSINDYFGEKKDFETFRNDKKLKRAIEREIEIIGEAINRVTKQEPDIIIENSRRIIDTRNWVIHGYDKVDDIILWGIIVNHLPKLKEEVVRILKMEE
ncbi:MAG TPA: DUF86 domain-containing protein [Bacteroidales bacterium]|nr:DUF86 domain-containing protein [Bacteroidales bacterium]HRZ49991.1 DUF86 domain-containing protein [Bacteroidales bacterium]